MFLVIQSKAEVAFQNFELHLISSLKWGLVWNQKNLIHFLSVILAKLSFLFLCLIFGDIEIKKIVYICCFEEIKVCSLYLKLMFNIF